MPNEPEERATSLLTKTAGQNVVALHAGLNQRILYLERVLGRGGDASRFIEVAMMAVQSNPRIAECEPETVLCELWRCATYRLLPDGVQAALVPYAGRCQLQVMYRGFLDIVHRHPKVLAMDPPCMVYENDVFEFELGTSPYIKHKQAAGDRGEWTYVYSVCQIAGGARPSFRVLTREEVETQHRAKSRGWQRAEKGKRDSVWHVYPEPMILKTAVRVHCKYLPLSFDELRNVVSDDDRINAGMEVPVSVPAARTGSVLPGPPQHAPVDVEPEPQTEPVDATPTITQEQAKQIMDSVRAGGGNVEKFSAWLCRRHGTEKLIDIPADAFNGIVATIEDANKRRQEKQSGFENG